MSAPPFTGKLLVVDDEVELMRALCDSLTDEGFFTQGVSHPADAFGKLESDEFDILLTDLMMPGMDGIQLLRLALEFDPNLVTIVMTGQGTIQTAVEAMRAGAYDYVLKPFRIQQIAPVLTRAMELRRLRLENVRLKQCVMQLTFESPRYQIIGSGPLMQRVFQMIERVAPTDATVLIRGPSGTGKELVARALHGNSARKDKPLVAVNCAAMQETLLESELFGHEKGAFTGADRAKPGLFEVAEGGTLFVDEIGEMPPTMQAKLLRVLEDGRYRRVGGTNERQADVRIIAATNKPLEAEQKTGRFREDLYYRLNVITINLPPLKDRREDIPQLVAHFLKTRPFGKKPPIVEHAAMEMMTAYDWPGNVRELANVIERAQILRVGDVITPDDLPENFGQVASGTPVTPAGPDDLGVLERRHVLEVLDKVGGNKVQAAKSLGISRRSLYRMLAKYQSGDTDTAEGVEAE